MASISDMAAKLRGIAARTANMAPMLNVIGQDVITFVDDRFQTATDAAGAPWRGLSETTFALNPRRHGGTPLSDTSRLRRSFTVRAGANSLFFGTNAVQARAQFFGNPGNKVFGKAPGPIPARSPLPLSADGAAIAPQSFWDDARARLSHWLATGEVT